MKKLYIIGMLAVILSSCSQKKVENASENKASALVSSSITLTESQAKAVQIQLDSVQSKLISHRIEVSGQTEVPPQNLITVSAPLGGYLKSTDLLPGMPVRKGQVIAILEDPQYVELQQNYLSAKAKLPFLEQDAKRQQSLFESQAGSEKQMQLAKSEFTQQQILVKALQEKLNLIGIDAAKLNVENLSRSVVLRSPIDGYVSQVKVNIGKYVQASEVVVELINPSDLHLKLKVFEKDMVYLQAGQKVEAKRVNGNEKTYPAEIILIGQNLDSDRSTEVHCHFEGGQGDLKPGMYMTAHIDLDEAKVKALPEDALVYFEGKQYVFVANGSNTYKLVEVQLGRKERGFIEIVNGDELASERVVVKGSYNLLMAMKNSAEE
jgi:cobalt-zinc-cadmium efflux system membrane fusion protein